MRHRTHSKEPQKTADFFKQLEKMVPGESRIVSRNASGESLEETKLVKIRHKPVAWGFCLDEVMFSKWFAQFLRWPVMPWDTLITAQSTYLPDARNTVHRDFISTGVERLVMLDSDVIPPPDFLGRLLAHKLPMVGGWYRKKADPYPPTVYDFERIDEEGIYKYNIRKEPGTGLESVDGAGAGCWLMHRDVAVAIGEGPYDMLHGGEDLALCRRVHEAGFETWIDWSVACAHAGVAIT